MMKDSETKGFLGKIYNIWAEPLYHLEGIISWENNGSSINVRDIDRFQVYFPRHLLLPCSRSARP